MIIEGSKLTSLVKKLIHSPFFIYFQKLNEDGCLTLSSADKIEIDKGVYQETMVFDLIIYKFEIQCTSCQAQVEARFWYPVHQLKPDIGNN